MSHDLVRVPAEDRKQVQAEVNGVTYNQHNGYFHMDPHHAKAHLVHGNQPTPAAAGPVGRTKGYRCSRCGFGSYFRKCSKKDSNGQPCNGYCERE